MTETSFFIDHGSGLGSQKSTTSATAPWNLSLHFAQYFWLLLSLREKEDVRSKRRSIKIGVVQNTVGGGDQGRTYFPEEAKKRSSGGGRREEVAGSAIATSRCNKQKIAEGHSCEPRSFRESRNALRSHVPHRMCSLYDKGLIVSAGKQDECDVLYVLKGSSGTLLRVHSDQILFLAFFQFSKAGHYRHHSDFPTSRWTFPLCSTVSNPISVFGFLASSTCNLSALTAKSIVSAKSKRVSRKCKMRFQVPIVIAAAINVFGDRNHGPGGTRAVRSKSSEIAKKVVSRDKSYYKFDTSRALLNVTDNRRLGAESEFQRRARGRPDVEAIVKTDKRAESRGGRPWGHDPGGERSPEALDGVGETTSAEKNWADLAGFAERKWEKSDYLFRESYKLRSHTSRSY
uniref:Cyclic nucleotide-binding domain-containing protein n=1 Tax=Steinernema glaseri TaxID=37863 RepID=A0A1I7ZR71_9BILA